MKGIIFLILAVIAVSIIVFAVVITRDGKLVTPQGQGIVTLDVSQFEAFPLPDYATKHVTDGPDHVSTPAFRTIEQYIQGLDIPAEIVWGMKDPILGYQLPVMKRNFPKAPVTKTKAGHFLQEEVPAGIAAALLRVIDQVQKS